MTALRDEGWTVELAADGVAAVQQLRDSSFDLVVLDLMLPGLDGLAVLRDLRSRSEDAHVLVVTARDAVEDRVAILDAGADDYLVKPFSMSELLARARALLRRRYGKKSPVIEVGPLAVDTASHEVTMGGELLEFTAREYTLLEYVAFRAGELVTREELRSALYGEGEGSTSNVLDVYVGYVRKKLEAGGVGRMLHTRRGQGYILQPPQ